MTLDELKASIQDAIDLLTLNRDTVKPEMLAWAKGVALGLKGASPESDEYIEKALKAIAVEGRLIESDRNIRLLTALLHRPMILRLIAALT